MKSNFINKPLIFSFGICSAFIAFSSALITLHFRQEAFFSAKNIQQIEKKCSEIENSNIALAAYIAQIQTPLNLKENLFDLHSIDLKNQILKVHDWENYKESFMTRNALALNHPKDLKF